jgi:hypothetical protein
MQMDGGLRLARTGFLALDKRLHFTNQEGRHGEYQ